MGVVGCGYVGLVTGACLAYVGHRVTCVDNDGERVVGLKEGRMPFYEPGLEGLVARGVQQGRLSFVSLDGLARLDEEADVVFVSVDTPQGEDGSADLSNIATVARDIGRTLAEADRELPIVVVNKSTVPVGSGDYVSVLVREGPKRPAVGTWLGGGASCRRWSRAGPTFEEPPLRAAPL